MGASMTMKKIKLLKRSHVDRVGTCEKGATTPCADSTAAYLVKIKTAEYVKGAAAKAKQ